ncbi:MATE family efflux transporter [bacterium]|nr:MATE family efflux transporter [bacterium]
MQTNPPSVGKINRAILRLALPAIFSNITVPLLGLSDTFISGHLGAERYLAAIAAGTVLVNSLYWLFGFLRMGTTGLTAEAFGRNDLLLRRRVFTMSFLLAFSLGLLLMILSVPLSRMLLWIMEPEPATAALAGEYFRISILAAPAFLATMTVTGWMIGSQNTLYPMITAITVNIINITLSMTFVFGMKLGFYGVALGTCIANWSGLLIALLLARHLAGADQLWAPLKGLWKAMDMRRFFRVNSDLMLRSACIMAVLFAMTTFAGRMGDSVLARNAVLMQFFMFFSYFMDGFAYAGEALCGRFAGAADPSGIYRTVKGLMIWAVIMTVVFTAVYFFFLTPVTALLTDEASVINGVSALKWVAVGIPVISAAAFIFDGVYIGMTATSRLLLATLAAMILFFLTMLPYLLGRDLMILPDRLLWCAFLIFLLTRGVSLAILLPSTLRRIVSPADHR